MRLHKNARLTPILREELARKVVFEALPLNVAASEFNVSPKTAAKWIRRFRQDGHEGMMDRSSRPTVCPRQLSADKSDSECKSLLVSMLHRPPGDFGINRTSWKLDDLHRVARQQGTPLSRARLQRVLKDTGFKWRKARVVLTSGDPEYAQKVHAIKDILASLKGNEAFFSIDEFGPFSIKRKGGRKRVGPDESYVIPQWQRSKGYLILTAALELSTNQVTHFYSPRKNTDEMIKMAELLRSKYANCQRIYLSWDAASWHVSKKLKTRLEELNRDAFRGFPVVALAPLPAGAQFLNVVESVFSGLARAILHNSDYPSPGDATAAIDRYFLERNQFFQAEPSRAGQRIWLQERSPCEFSEGNNCKDPSYR